tara:strand:- start:1780 stop:1980 length:201 start_codon:yes stop_codon:yes gene_type:complete
MQNLSSLLLYHRASLVRFSFLLQIASALPPSRVLLSCFFFVLDDVNVKFVIRLVSKHKKGEHMKKN